MIISGMPVWHLSVVSASVGVTVTANLVFNRAFLYCGCGTEKTLSLRMLIVQNAYAGRLIEKVLAI